MNRRELVLALAERTDSDRKTADAAVTALTEIITATVAKGEPVAISGFAKFSKVQTKARVGRNPQTGEAIKIPARKKVRVTPLKAFKEAVLAGRAPAAKAPAKKTTAKKATKKAPAKKAPAKKTTAKKTVKRAPAKKAPAKKATRRR